MTDLMRLNSLLGLDLDADDDAPGVPLAGGIFASSPTIIRATSTRHSEFKALFEALLKKESNSRAEIVQQVGWRCNYFLPSGVECNTANGLRGNTKDVRKTCVRCARPRQNKFTLEQEIERESLIGKIMAEKRMDYSSALAWLLEVEN